MLNNNNNAYELDTSLFDGEHDMDLVLLLSNARTDDEFRDAARVCRNRMRNRRAALRTQPSRSVTPSAALLRKLTPSALLRG